MRLGASGIKGKARWREPHHSRNACLWQIAFPKAGAPRSNRFAHRVKGRRLGGWLRAEEEAGKRIFPPRGSRLRAFELTPLDAVRVVILGQDPYHGEGQAHGLSFSVPAGVKPPPSLANIFRELVDDCDVARPEHGDLAHWARQGVLLLNSALTVEAGRAGSHAGRGWEALTDAAVAAVAARQRPTVFILWGSHAQGKAERIPELQNAANGTGQGDAHHLIIRNPHPVRYRRFAAFSARNRSAEQTLFSKNMGLIR